MLNSQQIKKWYIQQRLRYHQQVVLWACAVTLRLKVRDCESGVPVLMKVLEFTGPARCFDSEEEAFQAVQDRTYKEGEVLVIRYEGPKGGPGMREMLATTAALYGQGVGDKVALITDGRFSGSFLPEGSVLAMLALKPPSVVQLAC